MSKTLHKEWSLDNLELSLDAKYKEALQLMETARKWYKEKRFSIRRWSQVLRGFSILLAGIGGIAPLLDGAGVAAYLGSDFAFSKWGYIGFGLAAAFILFDKYYGLSSGWVRCMLAEMEMDALIEEFKDAWTMEIVKRGGKAPDTNVAMTLLGLIMNYKNRTAAIERNETEAWANEFQANMAEIQKLVKVETSSRRLGSIKLRVVNAHLFDQVQVKLNGVESTVLQGSVGHIPGVAPGQHVIGIIGLHQGQEYVESEVADVQENSMAHVDMKLPTPFLPGAGPVYTQPVRPTGYPSQNRPPAHRQPPPTHREVPPAVDPSYLPPEDQPHEEYMDPDLLSPEELAPDPTLYPPHEDIPPSDHIEPMI